MSEIEDYANAGVAADAVARIIAGTLRGAAQTYGRANFVATGGGSPGPVYDRLVEADVPWGLVNVTLSDERWVDQESADSNQHLLFERLFRRHVTNCRFVPLKTDAPSAEVGALTAEPAIAWLTPFDVTLLGMGEDGHIASLFPGNPALAEGLNLSGERLVIHAPAGHPAPSQDRISLTLKALLSSRLILVLTSGEAKRHMIERGEARPIHALLQQAHAPVRLIWSP